MPIRHIEVFYDAQTWIWKISKLSEKLMLQKLCILLQKMLKVLLPQNTQIVTKSFNLPDHRVQWSWNLNLSSSSFKITKKQNTLTIQQNVTSSVVKSWSFMGKEAWSSKVMEVTEPRTSSGVSVEIKSAAVDTFLKVVSPSSYL